MLLGKLNKNKHRKTRLGTLLTNNSGIGLETSILFAKEGANVLMGDISEPALEKALAKVKQLVPSAGKVETKVPFSLSLSLSFFLKKPPAPYYAQSRSSQTFTDLCKF